MITKTLELVSRNYEKSRLCNIKIQVNDEDYDRILAAIDNYEVDTKVRMGAKLMKKAIKVPQVRAVLPDHLVELGIKNTIKKVNSQLEQISEQYGVERLYIEDKSR